jgi:hypothetical protein
MSELWARMRMGKKRKRYRERERERETEGEEEGWLVLRCWFLVVPEVEDGNIREQTDGRMRRVHGIVRLGREGAPKVS